MKQRKTVRRQLLALALISLFLIPLLPLAGSDTPPGTPYYVYGFVEDESGPVVGAVVNLSLSTGGVVVAWNETTADANGLYIALFQSASVSDMVAGRVGGVTNNLLVDSGPGGWLNFTYAHLEYILSPGWNLISMGLLTSTLASDITSQTSTCLFIVNWSASAKAYTQTYARGSTEGDFELVDGYGYWAYAETVETFNITGVEKTGPKTYTLVPGGWNLIGWTDNTTTTTASELCNLVNDTYYGGVRGYITPWNTSRQEYDNGYLESSLFPPGAFPDIPIQRKSGYWMWVSTATSWTPDPQPPEWSEDIRLAWGGRRHNPHIAVEGENVYVVWENRTSPYNIFLRKSNDLGLSWGPEIRVSDSGTSLTLNPRIAVSGDYVYVVWTDTRSGTREAYLRASYDGGMSWQPEKAMSTEADNLKSNTPDVVAVEDMVFVAWDEEVEWDTGLGGKVPELYFANSTDRGQSFTVQRITECEYKPPDWDPDSSTSPKIVVNYPNMHITYDKWYSPDRGSIAAKSEAFYMMSPDGGGSWTAPTNLSTAGNVRVAYSHSIAVEGSNVYALWRDSKDAYFEAYLRISRDGGNVWGPEMRLSPLEGYMSIPNDIAVRGQEVLVTFSDERDWPGTGSEIYFLKSEDGGESWGEYTRLTEAPYYSTASQIALSYTHTHIVWQDNRNGGASSDYEVYYMRSPGWL